MNLRHTGLFLLLWGLLTAGPAAAEEVEITEAARAHFAAGVNFMQDPDGARYEEAYREFKAAYASAPSWKILGNLGICAMKLERDGEAIEAFDKYLSAGGGNLDAAERAQFERDLQTLRTGVVMVTITSVPPGAKITDQRVPVQGNVITNRYELGSEELIIGVRSGHHRIVARRDGYEDATWEFDAVTGSSLSHTFELQQLTATPRTSGGAVAAPGTDRAGPTGATGRPVTTGVYAGTAVTGALLIGGGVVGVLALGKKSEYDGANDGSDPAAAKDLQASVKTLNLVTDALLGAAVVGVAVTTYLYVSTPEQAVVAASRLRVIPYAGVRAGGLLVEGAF